MKMAYQQSRGVLPLLNLNYVTLTVLLPRLFVDEMLYELSRDDCCTSVEYQTSLVLLVDFELAKLPTFNAHYELVCFSLKTMFTIRTLIAGSPTHYLSP